MLRFVLSALILLAVVLSGAQTGPYAGGGDVKQAQKDLARYSASYKMAKAAFTKKPKDAKLKQAYVAATVRLGTASMTSPALDRKVKYKQALSLYREALKVDPKNAEAKNNSEMIISIYRQMGRPIPH